MKLIDNWAALSIRLSSQWFVALTLVLSVAEVLLPFFTPFQPGGRFAMLAAATSIAALIARLVPQPQMIAKVEAKAACKRASALPRAICDREEHPSNLS